MSVGSIKGYTLSYRFVLVDYNVPGWHTYEYQNWRALDGLLNSFVQLLNFQGVWLNNTPYTATMIVDDPDTSLLYKCLVGHTSAAAGSFSADRIANPGNWAVVDQTAFDATSVRLLKRASRMNQSAMAMMGSAQFINDKAAANIAAAAAAAVTATAALTATKTAASQAVISADYYKRTVKKIRAFSPGNAVFQMQVFGP